MSRKIILMIAAIAMGALLIGSYVVSKWGNEDALTACRRGVAPGDMGGPFTLIDKDGRTVTDKDVITEPTLLYFGYTFCPDVCPFDVARNADAVDVLAGRGYSATPIFISIDPERDTPQQVGEFASNMHERMIGLTGSPEQIATASKAYRTYFRKQDSDDEYYLVDHSTFTYLVLPEQGFVDFFRREVTPEQMAERVACFIDATQEEGE